MPAKTEMMHAAGAASLAELGAGVAVGVDGGVGVGVADGDASNARDGVGEGVADKLPHVVRRKMGPPPQAGSRL